MVIRSIVVRDLIRFVRSPMRTFLLLAIPLGIGAVFAISFPSGDPKITIRVLLYDEDEGLLGQFLSGAANNTQADEQLEIVPVGAEGYAMMDEGEASALIHIPEGFTDDYLGGKPTTLKLVKNPAQRFLPQIVEEGIAVGVVLLSQTSRVLRPELETLQGMFETEAFPADLAVGTLSVSIKRKFEDLDRFVFPPVIQLETATLDEQTENDEAAPRNLSTLNFFLPGLSIMGLLFFAQAATYDILGEKESGQLRHLLTAPVSVRDYLLGKTLSVLVVSMLGFSVLIAVGLVAGVYWGPLPAVLVLLTASAIGAAGLLMLIMSLARTRRQADAITTVVIMVGSMIGGSFFPISQLPSFILPVSRFTVNYWAAEGFMTLITRGGGLVDILPNVLMLTGVGVAFLLFGTTALHRKITSGAV
jgi:ABC-2 type transport system permease protein